MRFFQPYRKEVRSNSSIHIRQRRVDLLRIPVRLIPRPGHRVHPRLIRHTGIHAWEIFLHIVQCEERVRFLVVTVEDDEFAVVGHGFVHGAGVVDDYWTAETGVCVLVHADVGVVGPEFAVRAWVRCGSRWDEPGCG